MKVQHLSMALLAIGLVACTNDENDILSTDPVAARSTANIGNEMNTRVTNENQWEADKDLIGISYTTTSGDKSGTNISYKATSTQGSFTPSSNPIYLEGSDTYTFSAYYPYNSDIAEENTIITASTTAENQGTGIDFLYASSETATKGEPDVDFTFAHCMSLLSLTFTQGEGLEGATMSEYTLSGIYLNGTFDTSTGKATATTDATGETEQETTLTMSAGFGSTSSVLLFPQTLSNGITVNVTIDGNIYSATLNPKVEDETSTELKAGYKYAYTITVTKVGLRIEGATITSWGEGTDGSGSVAIPATPIA